jgi:hypothetical protein
VFPPVVSAGIMQNLQQLCIFRIWFSSFNLSLVACNF